MSSVKETSEKSTVEVNETSIEDNSNPVQKKNTNESISLKGPSTNNNNNNNNQNSMPYFPRDTAYYQPNNIYYPYQNQPNTSPASPASGSLRNDMYDAQSILAQQPSGSSSFGGHQFNNNNNITLSPSGRGGNKSFESNLPPASPLFPGTLPLYSSSSEQLDSNIINGASMFASTGSPSFQYMTGPPPSPVISYGFAPSLPSSPDARGSWADSLQHMYNTAPASSPHLHGVPMSFQGNIAQSRRTTSFDGEMLPPSAVDDNPSAMYSTTGTVLHQPSWALPPQQHVAQIASPPRNGVMQGRDQIPNVVPGAYYPATTPGPPIQTSPNNKGPDGANLFIFHIPNHFTNVDMWHLFCHYGNLLSVRIMVEKDTGRSRGFGFVSYDSPDAAAMAIKELNGFVIGNKRLKVQHKQIRPSENTPAQQQQDTSQLFQENWTGNDSIEQNQYSSPPKDTKPPPLPDVEEDDSATSGNVGSSLANLKSVREALPDV